MQRRESNCHAFTRAELVAQAWHHVHHTLSVTNTDSSACVPANFNLAAAVPSGWTGALATSSLTIVPGSSASTTLNVTSTPVAANGSYAISTSATNVATGQTGPASATYVVLAYLTVHTSTNQASYSRNQTVVVTAKVWAASSVASGASVTFTITKSNGTVVTGTATTDANGVATYSQRLSRKDPTGVYQANATAGLNGIAGSGATSFSVK